MRSTLALAALLAAARALAGPIGADDPHAASPTGFPGVYLRSVELSLAAEPRYGSRLLDALETHLRAVGVMTNSREVSDYLEQSAGSEGVRSLRRALGREPLDPPKAAALLLADALARPEQFHEVLDGLESLKHGVGRHARELLRGARGAGDKRLFKALREAADHKRDQPPSYPVEGWFSVLFDARSVDGRDGLVLEDIDAAATEPAPRLVPRSRALDTSPSARP